MAREIYQQNIPCECPLVTVSRPVARGRSCDGFAVWADMMSTETVSKTTAIHLDNRLNSCTTCFLLVDQFFAVLFFPELNDPARPTAAWILSTPSGYRKGRKSTDSKFCPRLKAREFFVSSPCAIHKEPIKLCEKSV